MPARWKRLLAPASLYETPLCDSLATEAAAGRRFRARRDGSAGILEVELLEDRYAGYVKLDELEFADDDDDPRDPATGTADSPPSSALPITPAHRAYAVAFVLRALPAARPRDRYEYLWGGCLGPRFDCSGLVQTAYASAIAPTAASSTSAPPRIPRDAHQQREHCVDVPDPADALPGDLLFFGDDGSDASSPEEDDDEPGGPPSSSASASVISRRRARCDHVAMLIAPPERSSSGEDPAAVTLTYAHCSCRATGRDGVAADAVVVRCGGAANPGPREGADAVAARYATRFRGVGRPTRTL